MAATLGLRAKAKEEAAARTGRLGEADDAPDSPAKPRPAGFGPEPALAAAHCSARGVGYDLRRAPLLASGSGRKRGSWRILR